MSDQSSFSISNLEPKLRASYRAFLSCIRFYGLFHVGFICFLSLQLLGFLLFFSYFSQSLAAAFGLAIFCLTLFTYFVLLFFFQAKKPEQFDRIKKLFMRSFEVGPMTLSETLQQLSLFVGAQQTDFFFQYQGKTLGSAFHTFTTWLHWKHFHQFRESLYLESINLLLSLVKTDPTSLKVHASLATAYAKLSELYLHPQKLSPRKAMPWTPQEYNSSSMESAFVKYSNKAVEELQILQELSPNDPWTLAQLANQYRLQEKTEQEITHCEKLLDLSPENKDLMLQLGVLYFKKGQSGKGLKMYQRLLTNSSDKARELIAHYE